MLWIYKRLQSSSFHHQASLGQTCTTPTSAWESLIHAVSWARCPAEVEDPRPGLCPPHAFAAQTAGWGLGGHWRIAYSADKCVPGTLCPEVMAILAWSRLKGYPEKKSMFWFQKSVNVNWFGKKKKKKQPLQAKLRILRWVHCGITHVTSVLMREETPM